MADYTISQADLRDAEAFLSQFIAEKVPEANVEEGGAVRDLLVKGFTYIYAFLRGEVDRVTARQSLLRIQEELTEDDDIAEAVDELLSNWFATRKDGTTAEVMARLHFSERRAHSIPAASKFWRTNTALFYLDTDVDPYVVTEDQQFPIFDSTGTLVDYVVDVPLRAAQAGTGYNIDPGTFIKVEVSGGLAYLSYAENTESSSGGDDLESSEEFIERADTVISVRNLINNRSCDVTLQEEFPDILDTLTVGMAEPEMIRDRRLEIGKHLQLHIGGHYDTYVTLPTTTVDETGVVGGFFTRPDNIAAAFRDPYLTYDLGATFTSLGVQPGHVLYLRSGFIGLPRGFQIVGVSDHELEVSTNTPFPVASDEELTNEVQYSIGWLAPGFEEVPLPDSATVVRTAAQSALPATSNVPWGTSRRIQQSGKIVLSGKPVQDISWVEITDPTGTLSQIIDPSTETVVFNNRVNTPPLNPLTGEPAETQYQLEVLNYQQAQSMNAVNVINLGLGDSTSGVSDFDGMTAHVTYTSLSGFSSVHSYVVNRNQRVACANQLVRGRNPVWIEVNVPYKLKNSATDTLDEDLAAQSLAAFINEFDAVEDLDVSDISGFLRQNFSDIGSIYALEVYFHLDAPDGQQAYFSTTDIVSVFVTDTNGVVLENGADITPPTELVDRGVITNPYIMTADDLANWMVYLGVSDRTVQYQTTDSRITFELRG